MAYQQHPYLLTMTTNNKILKLRIQKEGENLVKVVRDEAAKKKLKKC